MSTTLGSTGVTFPDATTQTTATKERAFVNFNGSNGAIRASYNVSSITRNATGDYTLNFTSAMPDTNYVATAMPLSWNTNVFYATAMMIMGAVQTGGGATLMSTTQLRVMTGLGSNAGAFDHQVVSIAVFR